MKEYGQDLKKTLAITQRKLHNVQAKIEKRFSFIIENHVKYISEIEINYIKSVGVNDLTIEKKLDIVINAEKRYVEENSNQLDMFGS